MWININKYQNFWKSLKILSCSYLLCTANYAVPFKFIRTRWSKKLQKIKKIGKTIRIEYLQCRNCTSQFRWRRNRERKLLSTVSYLLINRSKCKIDLLSAIDWMKFFESSIRIKSKLFYFHFYLFSPFLLPFCPNS